MSRSNGRYRRCQGYAKRGIYAANNCNHHWYLLYDCPRNAIPCGDTSRLEVRMLYSTGILVVNFPDVYHTTRRAGFSAAPSNGEGPQTVQHCYLEGVMYQARHTSRREQHETSEGTVHQCTVGSCEMTLSVTWPLFINNRARKRKVVSARRVIRD